MKRRYSRQIVKSDHILETKDGVIPYQLARSKARRTLSIVIDEQARVKVSVPYSTKENYITAFLNEKSKWILKSVAHAQKNQDYLNQKTFEHGQEFLFLGKKYNLNVKQRDIKRTRFKFDGERWNVWVPKEVEPDEQQKLIKKKMIQWYRAQAEEILGGRIFHYSRIMGVEPKRIAVRTQKRIWGCCDYLTQTIHLNWQIILSPIKVVDYVVVHEMCHLTIPNHSKRFWKRVEKFMPDYKEYKKWLSINHLDMMLP